MEANPRVRLAEVPVTGSEGSIWNRLHTEREDICEAMLKQSANNDVGTNAWHQELLQSRLRKIDDALDRLMSGSYGNCSKCGRWIEDTKLEFDPAISFCVACWRDEVKKLRAERSATDQNTRLTMPTADAVADATETAESTDGVELSSLSPFDTVLVETHNSHYRIFLLDPKTGRALVEGGSQFPEPVEAIVYGSTVAEAFRIGWIGVGLRLEMWINENIVSTSLVKSVTVHRHSSIAAGSSTLIS